MKYEHGPLGLNFILNALMIWWFQVLGIAFFLNTDYIINLSCRTLSTVIVFGLLMQIAESEGYTTVVMTMIIGLIFLLVTIEMALFLFQRSQLELFLSDKLTKRHDQQLQNVINKMPVAVAVFTKDDHKLCLANQTFCQLFNGQPHDFAECRGCPQFGEKLFYFDSAQVYERLDTFSSLDQNI